MYMKSAFRAYVSNFALELSKQLSGERVARARYFLSRAGGIFAIREIPCHHGITGGLTTTYALE